MKYKYTYEGKEINIGDVIEVVEYDMYGGTSIKIPIKIINENTVISLMHAGIPIKKSFVKVYPKSEDENLHVEDYSNTKKRPTKLGTEIYNRLAEVKPEGLWLDISEEVEAYLYKISPATVYNLYSIQIAKYLDKSYEGHIEDCDTIWTIDDFTGKPWELKRFELPEKDWHNLINNTGCYRNKVDLIVSQKILRGVRKAVWTGKSRRRN